MPLFLIFFSLLSVVTVGATHFFIQQKLGDKHDNGLLWVAGALFFWFLIGLFEYRYSAYPPEYLKEHYLEMWPYWYGRKVLSIFNSALFIYSLSYFRDGWLQLHKRLEKINLRTLAIITFGLCFATFPLNPTLWLLTDTVVSVIVALLLCMSMATIFYQRGLRVMAAFAVVVCFFLMFNQVSELLKDPNFSVEMAFMSWFNQPLMRIIAMPSLVMCILVLAISWLGSQLEEEVVSRPPAHLANSLRFETRGIRNYVTISLQAEDFALQNKVFDFTNRPSPYTFLKRCAERACAEENFHRDEFTDNFDMSVKRLLEALNQKLANEDFGHLLQKSDLFVRDGKGIYKLVFAKDEISL